MLGLRIVIAAGLTALATAGSARAAAAPPLRFLSSAQSPAAADGVRFAAFEVDADTTRVVDLRRRRAFDAPTPPRCATARPSPLAARGVAAVGGGQVVWRCAGEVWMLDLASRRAHRPPGDAAVLALAARVEPIAVGARWIAFELSGPGMRRHRAYLDWHTGAVKRGGPSSVRLANDLDVPGLRVRLCPGLRRRANPSPDEPPLHEYLYDAPFGVTDESRGPLTLTVIERCGGAVIRTLPAGGEREAGGGYLTTTDLPEMYRLRDGAQTVWRLPARDRGRTLRAAHTGSRFVLSIAPAFGPEGRGRRWRVVTARVP